MRKRFYVHFEKGFNLGFLLELKAFSLKQAENKIKKMLERNPNEEMKQYTIYDSKSVVNLANEYVLSLTKEKRIEEFRNTYLMVWESTKELEEDVLLMSVKQQLLEMDETALSKMKKDVLGNDYVLFENKVKYEIQTSEKLEVAEAMIGVVKAIERELLEAKARLFKLDEQSNENEMRETLKEYFLVVARIREAKGLIKGNEYDWLLERYFEIL